LERPAFDYKSRAVFVLWMLNFLLTFAVALISTPIPYLAREFVTGEDVEAATTAAYGIIVSLGYVALTIGSLLGGLLADTIGRRTVIFVSFVVLAAGVGLFAVSPSMYWLFLSSFVEMFAVGFSGPAISALVADYSSQHSRGTAYGVFNLSWVTAQVPAPLLGGVTAQVFNLRTPFYVAISISVVGMLFATLMKGKNVEKRPAAEKERVAFKETDPKQTASLRRVTFLFGLTRLLNGLLNGFISPVLNSFLMFKLNADLMEYGLVFSVASGVVTGLVQVPGGKLADKFGRKPLVLFGFLAVPLILAAAFSQTILEFMLFMGAISAVGNISGPAISAWLMDLVPEHKRASISGIMQTLSGAGYSAGPYAGSFVWNSTQPDTTIPFVVTASIFAMSLPFYLMVAEPRRASQQISEAPESDD
jgi:MFS family permease